MALYYELPVFKDVYKMTLHLEQFMDSFEVVKLEVRLCRDLKLVSIELSLYQIKQ